jgi:predicted SAM-dependent methyltransferase
VFCITGKNPVARDASPLSFVYNKVHLQSGEVRLVNLGCGNRYHPDWINLDLSAAHPSVIACDLTAGIPLEDSSCQAVYASHLFEHLNQAQALFLMQQCHRILTPAGVLRVVVPDLEEIARLYLENLKKALEGDEQARNNYKWILLEMYDQFAREESGGEMSKYLKQRPLPNAEFVFERIGEGAQEVIHSNKNAEKTSRSFADGFSFRRLAGPFRKKILSLLLRPNEKRALEIGKFRLSGENHRWMYDRYSLAQLMLQAGFQEAIKQPAHQSCIQEWGKFYLDTFPDGTVRKPDSLFMEAIKRAE